MKFVIQRVLESAVKVDGKTIGEIGKGLVVLIGVGREDTKEIADKIRKKIGRDASSKMKTARRIFLWQMSMGACF